MKTYVVTPHWNCLGKTILMMGHNIGFKGVIWKIIRKFVTLAQKVNNSIFKTFQEKQKTIYLFWNKLNDHQHFDVSCSFLYGLSSNKFKT